MQETYNLLAHLQIKNAIRKLPKATVKYAEDAKIFYVYGLLDPQTTELRYVGITFCLQRRMTDHFKPSKLKTNTHKNNWLKSLLNNDSFPEIIILETHFSIDEVLEAEIDLIAYYRFIGCNLTNSTIGGEGIVGYKYTEEQRVAISKRNSGRKFSEEHRKKISESGKGRIISAETRMRISIAHKNPDLRAKKHDTRTNNGTVKLSMELANEIRKLYQLDKVPQKELSNKFGVERSIISSIITNRIYIDTDYNHIPHSVKTQRDPFTDNHRKNLSKSRMGHRNTQSSIDKSNLTRLQKYDMSIDKANEIIALHGQGYTYLQLASMYGMSKSTIRRIILGDHIVFKYRNMGP